MNSDPTAIPIAVDPECQHMAGLTYHKNISFDVPYMTEIHNNLWQGGCADGLVLPSKIQHLVSLYNVESYTLHHELKSWLIVEMYDAQDQATEQILDIASWVNSCRRSGPVLVHCQAGLNRSSLVVGAAMVLAGETTGPEAVERIRKTRSPACLCNQAFEDWLTDLRLLKSGKPAKRRKRADV